MKYFNATFLIIITITFCLKPINLFAQATLSANAPGNTYELINSIFAPNYTAVEAPDQCTSHPSFGRHILQKYLMLSTLSKLSSINIGKFQVVAT